MLVQLQIPRLRIEYREPHPHDRANSSRGGEWRELWRGARQPFAIEPWRAQIEDQERADESDNRRSGERTHEERASRERGGDPKLEVLLRAPRPCERQPSSHQQRQKRNLRYEREAK